jgi:HSP20 family molecular chaperone IbpA
VKWHKRKKRSRWSDAFKRFNREHGVTDDATHQKFQIKNRSVKRQVYPCKHRLPRSHVKRGRWKEPEALIDVLEGKDEMVIVAELAGFKREDIKVDIEEQKINLSANTPDRRYYKSLDLPKRVIPEAVCTAYKNGVFEIRMKKAIEEKTVDRMVG